MGVTVEQIEEWKSRIEGYKNTYSSRYFGSPPSEKLIASFCGIYHIPWPLPIIGSDPDETDWDFLK